LLKAFAYLWPFFPAAFNFGWEKVLGFSASILFHLGEGSLWKISQRPFQNGQKIKFGQSREKILKIMAAVL
jgi:hypothetical protein